MKAVNPYLNFPGTAEAAFNFYKSIFGGEFITVQRFKDTAEASRVAPADADKLMHISMPLGKGNILMATDAVESMGHPFKNGNNFHLTIDAESEEEARKLYDALSAGGNAAMPLAKTFWGAYFGMLTDKFGVQWMVNYDLPPGKIDSSMMIEVFKTNVQEQSQARQIIDLLLEHFPGNKINFDMHDCDKILRVEGKNFCPDTIKTLVSQEGFFCDVLE